MGNETQNQSIAEKLAAQTKKKKKANGPSLQRTLRVYFVPLLLIFVFIGLLAFLVIPKIATVLSGVQEIQSLNQEISNTNELIRSLQNLSAQFDEQLQLLLALDTLAPASDTEVVAFQQKLIERANQRNIIITRNSSAEQEPADDSINATLELREIRNNFTLIAPLSTLRDFITDLQTLDDFVVVQQMSLSPQDDENPSGNWALELQLLKYQFRETENAEQLRNYYTAVPIEAQIPSDVREYIEAR